MIRYLDPKNDLIFKRIFGEHPLLPFVIEERMYLSSMFRKQMAFNASLKKIAQKKLRGFLTSKVYDI